MILSLDKIFKELNLSSSLKDIIFYINFKS
jgi:hypothetical protein